MATLMLETKFHIPSTRPSLVRRPRLLAQLNEGLGRNNGPSRKLTLISAPAGFGKTTLVSEWVDDLRARRVPADDELHARSSDNARSDVAEESQIENRVAWLALDEGDNDLGRFLAYFITALSRVDGISATFGESARQMLQSTQPPSEDLLVALLNDVAAIHDRVIFVLDDYHSLDSGPIDQALTFLLEHAPPQIHLVVATREDPHLPLARLRASGQLTELRATDLRFTAAEAAEFLTLAMGLNLTQEEIAALESRTEGWIAGLQLAAISMRGSKDAAGFIKSFAGSHRFVLDYLIEEVLQQQAAGMQRFLLQTAILDRMTGALCDAVCFDSAEPSIRLNATAAATQADGAHVLNSRGQTTLEQLEQANLFVIPLDEERHWYRYHHLFADLLRLRLRQTEPDREPLLHQRASVWYEQNGFSKEAVDHALHGKDFERAAHVIEEQMEGGFERIDQATLARWLAAMPEEFVFIPSAAHHPACMASLQ